MRESDAGEKYVMALDVGTTTIRSMVYNKGGVVMGTAATPVRYSQVYYTYFDIFKYILILFLWVI